MAEEKKHDEVSESERREFKRFPLTFYVSYIDPETKIRQTGVYETYKDISLNGMFFKSKKRLQVDVIIEINLTIPGFDNVFPIKAKVIRSIIQEDGNCNVGVKFLSMPPEHKEEIEAFLKTFDHF